MDNNNRGGIERQNSNDIIIPDIIMTIKTEPEAICDSLEFDEIPTISKKAKMELKPSSSSNSTSTLIDEADSDDFDLQTTSILFTDYFKIVKKVDGAYKRGRSGITARCTICNISLQGSPQVTSNFIRHLKKRHVDKYKEYQKQKANHVAKNDIRNRFNEVTCRFIVDNMLPISIVESQSFKLFTKFTNPNLNLISRPTAVTTIDIMYSSVIDKIKEQIKSNKFLCTTADVWSTKHRSFLAYTCHWIDENFTRKSVALACRCFSGRHTNDRIRDLMVEIHQQFELDISNIVATTTDNGSNFVKAFKEFGVGCEQICGEISDDDDENNSDDDDQENAVLETIEISSNVFNSWLPRHIRCATHTLNLVATTDLLQILNQHKKYFEEHQIIMQKCSRLWGRAKKPKTSEDIKSVLGCQLKYPVATRWNSLYDSLKDIINNKNKLKLLCKMFKEPNFEESDFNYIEDYLMLLKPIAEAIDFLQGSKGMVYGYILPTLATIRVQYVKISTSHNNKHISLLSASVLEAVEARFQNYFNLTEDVNDAIIASVLCPEIKLQWITALNSSFTQAKINEVIVLVKNALSDESPHSPPQVKLVSAIKYFDFCLEDNRDFLPEMQHNPTHTSFHSYLTDTNTSFEMLDRYPSLKSTFLKFNTPLPSSAAVERLFSFAFLLNSPCSGSLSDSNFEKFMLLKANRELVGM